MRVLNESQGKKPQQLASLLGFVTSIRAQENHGAHKSSHEEGVHSLSALSPAIPHLLVKTNQQVLGNNSKRLQVTEYLKLKQLNSPSNGHFINSAPS